MVIHQSALKVDNILYGDRPFCSNLGLSSFVIATDVVNKKRIATTLLIGIIGQGAGGEEEQATIHGWLKGNHQPHGWQYQIRNDIMLTYEINYEKQLSVRRK